MRAPRPTPQVSILWRVFTVNVVVFGLAVFVLIVSPATISNPTKLTEVAVLVVGLAVTLLADLLLLAFVLAPVRALARLMADIDPMRPGQRASVGYWASAEASVLARAFNTMLDRIETERRESARRALAAQEAERLRIARELHDEVGQTLTAVALQAERAVAGASPEREALEEIVAVLHGSLADVRRIARELRPEALDDLGLVDALIALCLRVERQGPLRIRRRFPSDLPRMTEEVELVLYRVTQEALTNVLRHADATSVEVALDHGPAGLVLSIADDGSGLARAPSEHDDGGLAGMRERAMLIEADLALESRPGEGMKVALTVPFAVAG